jgi:predicted nucleotidyltransferase/biotin operon repressor
MLLNDSVMDILEIFLRNLNEPHNGSEIARVTGSNQKTISNILNRLEDEGFLVSRVVGRNKEFTIRFDDMEKSKRFLLSLENARTLRFLDRNPKVKEVVSKITPFIKGIAIVFGSYAKGTQKKESDLDVFIAGDYDEKKVKEFSELYGIRINVKKMSLRNFSVALREKDIFIKEILSSHVILLGTEEYLYLVLGEYYGR